MRLSPAPALFPDDVLLRERGFTIAYRPKHGEPVWNRDGREYRQSEALKKAKAERTEQLKKLEEAYTSE